MSIDRASAPQAGLNRLAAAPIPDDAELSRVRELCERVDPYWTGPEADALFLEAMRQSICWHAERSGFYRRLLELRGFGLAQLREIGDLARIPLIAADFFKANEVLSVPLERITLTLTSSGTTGQKSQMFFDDWSIRAPQRMVEFHFERNGWLGSEKPVNYLLFTYETESESRLGTSFTDNYLCGFAKAASVTYALRRTPGGDHEFDVWGTIRCLQEFASAGNPVRIFGFPSFLYFALKRMKDLGHAPLHLPAGSLIFLGGGWKGKADSAVSPSELYSLAIEMLGIPGERIRDGFGSVEHCVPYIECSGHRFHVPTWSRVLIRDLETLQPLPQGEVGFLSFLSPYITSVPAQAILMGDLASLHPATDCPCGAGTPFFQVLGRAGTARNKSCAIAASELLRGLS